MKHRVPGVLAIVVLFAVAVVATAVMNRPATVLTTGPCTMLGIAELADHPGQPFLVIDCEGFQFGVPAVLP